ncbi:hypothetical protein, partial [Pseudonocardia sulfidoxydans]
KDKTAEQFPYAEYPDFGRQLAGALAQSDPAARQAGYDSINNTVCQANAFDFLYAPRVIYGAREGVTFPERKDQRFPFTEVQRSAAQN